jgi:hypothetical protein
MNLESASLFLYKPIPNGNPLAYFECHSCKRQLPFYSPIAVELVQGKSIICAHCIAREALYGRACPQCFIPLNYSTERAYDYATKHNTRCRFCASGKKIYSNDIDRINARRESSKRWKKRNPEYRINRKKQIQIECSKPCPSCHRGILLKSISSRNRSIKNNAKCKKCAGKIKHQ